MIDWLGFHVVKVLSAALCRLPPEAAVWMGQRLGGLSYWFAPKRSRIGVQNLRAAFDGQLTVGATRRIIRACCRQLGASLVEMLRLPVMDEAYVDRYVTTEGRRHADEAIASGQPVVFLTGHYGNWELPPIASALKGRPIVALARAQEKFPRLYRLLVSYRESKGCTIIHKGGAMRQLIAALGQGKPIGIVGDQASRQGIFVDFFGRPALFATGPFELAYGRRALILPSFIRRLGGPYHRLVMEAPIILNRSLPRDAAVREGITRFAALLARHTTDDPSQWLWMHKRWKHTPARRALVLSDGKAGHLKQSLAIVEALKEQHPTMTHAVVEICYRHRLARAVALLWSWWMPGRIGAATCLHWTLRPDTARALLSRYADVLISCGASTVPANVLWAAENGAKSIVVMNPTPLPVSRFDLVVAPRHDGLPKRPNVVQTAGAISRFQDETLRQAAGRLPSHPRYRALPTGGARQPHPTVAVFLGGDTADYELGVAFAESLMAQVLAACDVLDAWCLVTTSRRTSPAVERALSERLAKHPRCRLLLIAKRDPIDGTMEGMLGSADVAVVTGESVSMVSEACTSGRHVVVVEPPLRQANRQALTKHQRFLRELAQEGYLRMSLLPEVQHAIRRLLSERRSAKRLDNFAKIREAVARLL